MSPLPKYAKLNEKRISEEDITVDAEGGCKEAHNTELHKGKPEPESKSSSSMARLSQSLTSMSQMFGSRPLQRQIWKPSEGRTVCGKYSADTKEAAIIYGIAQLLFRYGAPLTRIPHIVINVGDVLKVPTSIQCLPQILIISIGDGTVAHPTRTHFISLESSVDVGKVYDVDRLALDICDMAPQPVPLPPAPLKRESTGDFHTVDLDHLPQRHSTSTTPAGPPNIPHSPKLKGIPRTTGFELQTDYELQEILNKLDAIASKQHTYKYITSPLTCAIQASTISVLNYGGSAGDGILGFILGGFSGWYIQYLEKTSSQGVPELLVAMILSAAAHVIQRLWPGNYPYIFPGTSIDNLGIFNGTPVCQSVFGLASLIRLFPGTQITLGMLELNDNPVAGSVRMFQSFIRALKLGYGISIGSRLGVFILTIAGLENSSFGVTATANCPTDFSSVMQLTWDRLLLSILFSIAGIVNLTPHRTQVWKMMIATTASFVIFTICRNYLPSTEAAGVASFGMAIIANLMARLTNEIQVAFILAAMQYLGPGALGVKSAIKIFQETSDGMSFGTDMIQMAMALAIGIFMANKLVLGIQPGLQSKWLDKAMAF
ncbi:hypothetical protein BDR26DRAFT_915963 [Obelidium mucronatum]|nr:hypothetical protein BDR26DRAFT_915963 [Obelidium mucronatum]